MDHNIHNKIYAKLEVPFMRLMEIQASINKGIIPPFGFTAELRDKYLEPPHIYGMFEVRSEGDRIVIAAVANNGEVLFDSTAEELQGKHCFAAMVDGKLRDFEVVVVPV